jgi:hypothetical protein
MRTSIIHRQQQQHWPEKVAQLLRLNFERKEGGRQLCVDRQNVRTRLTLESIFTWLVIEKKTTNLFFFFFEKK